MSMTNLSGYPPLIMTRADFTAVLLPLTTGYAWGEKTIIDLWTKGAPTPDSVYGSPAEKRIIFPNQLHAWLVDVLNRQGRPLETAVIYDILKEKSR